MSHTFKVTIELPLSDEDKAAGVKRAIVTRTACMVDASCMAMFNYDFVTDDEELNQIILFEPVSNFKITIHE